METRAYNTNCYSYSYDYSLLRPYGGVVMIDSFDDGSYRTMEETMAKVRQQKLGWMAHVEFLKTVDGDVDWVEEYAKFHGFPARIIDAPYRHCIENHPEHIPSGDCKGCTGCKGL